MTNCFAAKTGCTSGAWTVPKTVMRFGRREQPARPRDRFEAGAFEIRRAAEAFPARDRQHEIDAGVVEHLRERDVIGPRARPALGHVRRRDSGREIRAEDAELELVAGCRARGGRVVRADTRPLTARSSMLRLRARYCCKKSSVWISASAAAVLL